MKNFFIEVDIDSPSKTEINAPDNKAAATCDKGMPNGDKTKRTICLVSGVAFSVLYALTSWIFSFFAVMVFAFSNFGAFDGIADVLLLLAMILFFFMPIFCILGIAMSFILRKRRNYLAALLIQLLPFDVLGIATAMFLTSIWT